MAYGAMALKSIITAKMSLAHGIARICGEAYVSRYERRGMAPCRASAWRGDQWFVNLDSPTILITSATCSAYYQADV